MIIWAETACPECGEMNWVYIGDINDFDKEEPRGVECWICHHNYWLDERNVCEDDDMDEAYIEEGRRDPV